MLAVKRFTVFLISRRVFSATAKSFGRNSSRHDDVYSVQINNQHREWSNLFKSSSKISRSRSKPVKNESDKIESKFNRYRVAENLTKSNVKPLTDDVSVDPFTEEPENLTILGADKQNFSSVSKGNVERRTNNVISLDTKKDNVNVPLEVLIRPDLRDLYNDETIQQSIENYINEMSPALRPFTFDLAYLINESKTLKRFVAMGVDVYRWNKPIEKGKYVMTLDFDRDCLDHLAFLNELGIKGVALNEFLSYNPWIFKETIDDLRVRVNYLNSIGWNSDELRQIFQRAPYLLNFSTKSLDTKLKWFEKKFQLTSKEKKEFVIVAPKLLTLPLKDISNTYFNINQQLAFSHEELKEIFRAYPKLFIYDYKLIELNFDFLFNEMNIPRSFFLLYPPVLKQSFQQIRTRCLYLKYLQRQQFDPTKPNFISLKDLCVKSNELFCQQVTKTSLKHYLNFMKTL